MKRRAWAARLALLLGGIAAALLVGEALVRGLWPQPLRPAWTDEVDGIRVARPSVRGRHRHPGAFDVMVTTNAQRFRSARDYAPEPPAGVTRLAALGDSLTFGWGASDEDTYPARLERLLGGPARVEVLNAAFPGTCLGEKVAWYEAGVRAFHPRLVLLALSGDDVDGDLYWQTYRLQDGRLVRNAAGTGTAPARSARTLLARLPGTDALARRSELFALFRRGLTRLLSRERTTALGQRPATPEEASRFRTEGLALLEAELGRLRDDTGADGATLAVVFIPFRQEVYPDGGWWADELRWKSRAIVLTAAHTAAALGVPFLDVTPALAARARGGPPLYHDGTETHPTPPGYAVIAESVAGLVREQAARR